MNGLTKYANVASVPAVARDAVIAITKNFLYFLKYVHNRLRMIIPLSNNIIFHDSLNMYQVIYVQNLEANQYDM